MIQTMPGWVRGVVICCVLGAVFQGGRLWERTHAATAPSITFDQSPTSGPSIITPVLRKIGHIPCPKWEMYGSIIECANGDIYEISESSISLNVGGAL